MMRRGIGKMDILNKVKELLFTKQFIVFIIIGCINTLSSSVFSACYSIVLGDVSAFIPGYLTGILVAYTLNSIFNFKEKLEWNKLIKYGISTIPNFIIQFIVVYIGVNILGINNYICYGLAAIIGVPVTFIIVKLFVFIQK